MDPAELTIDAENRARIAIAEKPHSYLKSSWKLIYCRGK
jgi:hypothetical protein